MSALLGGDELLDRRVDLASLARAIGRQRLRRVHLKLARSSLPSPLERRRRATPAPAPPRRRQADRAQQRLGAQQPGLVARLADKRRVARSPVRCAQAPRPRSGSGDASSARTSSAWISVGRLGVQPQRVLKRRHAPLRGWPLFTRLLPSRYAACASRPSGTPWAGLR